MQQPREPGSRIVLRPRGNTIGQLLSDLGNLIIVCVRGLFWVGFSVCVTVRLGRSKHRIPQAVFAAAVAVLTYLVLACALALGRNALVASAPGPALDCGDACCRIVTACDLHQRLEPLTRRSHVRPADHASPPSLYSALQVGPSTPRADLRGAAREAARRVRDGRFSDDEVDSLVPAIYRTAQFLEHDPSRQAYDKFFMPPGPPTNHQQPPDTGAVLRPLAPICSAAKGQCCENTVGGT